MMWGLTRGGVHISRAGTPKWKFPIRAMARLIPRAGQSVGAVVERDGVGAGRLYTGLGGVV